jgi:hypothetical protein
MESQGEYLRMFSAARFQPYLDAANNNEGRALDLYLWATDLAGALYSQLSFVEVTVRNALNTVLSGWNDNQPLGIGHDWALDHAAAPLLYEILQGDLNKARGLAKRESNIRHLQHPRQGTTPNQDDIIAHLMFSSWVRLIRPISVSERPIKQRKLWQQATHLAFPYAKPGDAGRAQVGSQLEDLRRLRNRIAHHDNILSFSPNGEQNKMLSLLAKMDRRFPAVAVSRSRVRTLQREDPRHTWK